MTSINLQKLESPTSGTNNFSNEEDILIVLTETEIIILLDESASGFLSAAKSAVDKALILVGIRDPPLEPLGSEYVDSLRQLSRTTRRGEGLAESFGRLLEQANKSLEMGDFVSASMALNFTLVIAEAMHSDLVEADKEFKRSGGDVSRKLERSAKRLPGGKVDEHREVVGKITKENKQLLSELSDLRVLLREARDAVDANDTAVARQRIREAKAPLAVLGSKAKEITERPKAKVSVPKDLPTRPSKGKQERPRTSYPKEKLRPVNPPVNPSVAEEQSLLGRIVDKIKGMVPEALAEEITVGNVTYDIPAEITELAGQLDNNPAKIYAYVRDEVEYTPYYGLMKGSFGPAWTSGLQVTSRRVFTRSLLRLSLRSQIQASGLPGNQ